ncbi:hypothetical protein [Leptospira sp. 'Mane']|uniref:hypothetical protein n=1 Tax=Leptospira sp. 'Mane' TaxID=3387407 RepID=UPI00398B460D
MKLFISISLISILFLGQCTPAEVPYSEKDISLISNLFEANQKMHEGLLLDPPSLSLVAFKSALDSLGSSTHPRLLEWKSRIEGLFPKNPKDLDASFVNLSQIASVLTEIKKAIPVLENYNQFYCPMVEKYWVAKGKSVQNPYAPEMRDCGEMLP